MTIWHAIATLCLLCAGAIGGMLWESRRTARAQTDADDARISRDLYAEWATELEERLLKEDVAYAAERARNAILIRDKWGSPPRTLEQRLGEG